jgi:hypothetical protein
MAPEKENGAPDRTRRLARYEKVQPFSMFHQIAMPPRSMPVTFLR